MDKFDNDNPTINNEKSISGAVPATPAFVPATAPASAASAQNSTPPQANAAVANAAPTSVESEESASAPQIIATTVSAAPTYEQIDMLETLAPATPKSRKTFTDNEKKLRRVKELSVFTFAKQMAEYIFACTRNAPKQYRWSIVGKLHDDSLALIEKLYLANAKHGEQRLGLQFEADVKIKLIAFYAEMAKNLKIISLHQFKTLSKHLLNCKTTLWGWIKCKN